MDGFTYDGSIEFEGETYLYDKSALASPLVSRLVFTVAKLQEEDNCPASASLKLMDVFEAVFGSYYDEYWRKLSDDAKAFQLVMELYNDKSTKN